MLRAAAAGTERGRATPPPGSLKADAHVARSASRRAITSSM